MKREKPPVNATDLVDAFARSETRFEAYEAILELGTEALPAIREGLKHGNWQVRRWCLICLDHIADAETLRALVPLLRDPKSGVRMWAVHSIACNHCKDVTCPIDAVPLLIERIEIDDSIRVRRMATVMLATEYADPRAVPVFRRILAEEDDRKLRLHARNGLDRYRDLGLNG